MNTRILWLTMAVLLSSGAGVQYLYAGEDDVEVSEQAESSDGEGATDTSVAGEETSAVTQTETPSVDAAQAAAPEEPQTAAPAVAETVPTVAQPEEKPAESTQQPATEQAQPAAQQEVAPASTVTPTPPAAPVETKPGQAAKKPQEEEIPGIDTLGLEEPGGNWLFKRIWWERAEARFEKIRSSVEQLFEARMTFLKKRSELDRDLFDPFYREVGLERGELREIVLYLIERIEKMRQQQGSLDDQEREFLNTLLKEQKTLEQMQADIDGIDKLDKAVDDAILLLAEQINRARSYENSAWQEFKAIGKELNDKRARERYYSMDAILMSIRDIDTYIKGTFSQHFQALAKSAAEHIDRVKMAVKALKDRNIDLKLEAEKLEGAAKQGSAEEAEETAAQPGFFGSIMHAIGNFFSSIWHLLFGWIGSSKA